MVNRIFLSFTLATCFWNQCGARDPGGYGTASDAPGVHPMTHEKPARPRIIVVDRRHRNRPVGVGLPAHRTAGWDVGLILEAAQAGASVSLCTKLQGGWCWTGRSN